MPVVVVPSGVSVVILCKVNCSILTAYNALRINDAIRWEVETEFAAVECLVAAAIALEELVLEYLAVVETEYLTHVLAKNS